MLKFWVFSVFVLLLASREGVAQSVDETAWGSIQENILGAMHTWVAATLVDSGILTDFEAKCDEIDHNNEENLIKCRLLQLGERYGFFSRSGNNGKIELTASGEILKTKLPHWTLIQKDIVRYIFRDDSQKNLTFYDWPGIDWVLFNSAMEDLSKLQLHSLLEKKDIVDWEQCKSICDVGGGSGLLVNFLLNEFPTIESGIVIDSSESALKKAKGIESNRFRVINASMFEEPPEKEICDCVILKGITSDWSEEKVVEIFERHVSKLLLKKEKQSRVFILDHFLVGGESSQEKFRENMDVMMTAIFGPKSKQRTPKEFEENILRKGKQLFKVDRVVETSSSLVVMELGEIERKEEEEGERRKDGDSNVCRVGEDNCQKGGSETKCQTTEQMHEMTLFFGDFIESRRGLDYTYHSHYRPERQRVQDSIVADFLCNGSHSERPWIIFTAGVMGCGKSWLLRHLDAKQNLPLSSFVLCDPDAIKEKLPEHASLNGSSCHVPTLLHKESGFISEIVREEAMRSSRHVIVDGSLRDTENTRRDLQIIRRRYPLYRIGILHVTCSMEASIRRMNSRATRIVPNSVLTQAMTQVPQTIDMIRDLGLADRVTHVDIEQDNIPEFDGGKGWVDFDL